MKSHTTLAILLAFSVTAFAAPGKYPTFTDAKKAGLGFQLQGEYVGMVKTKDGMKKYGAQVICYGKKFVAMGYVGGLPGEGWKRGDKTFKTEAMLKDGKLVFDHDGARAVVSKNEIQIIGKEGDVHAKLKKVVRTSPTLGKKPPKGAVVLFDGKSAKGWQNGTIVDKKYLGATNCESKAKFQDHSLHLEFRTPFMPTARGQARGNSGLYVHSRYEVQVLDSFGLDGKYNECGGIYRIAQPLVNMCLPPLSWQTYDVDFTAPRYDKSGKKIKNARVTVKHNGVVIHSNLELPRHTPGRHPEGVAPMGIFLQNHGNPVVYRNIWVVPKK